MRRFRDIQIVIITNFVVVSSVGIKRADCTLRRLCFVIAFPGYLYLYTEVKKKRVMQDQNQQQVANHFPSSGASYGMVDSTGPRTFPMRQWRRVFLLTSPVSLFFTQIVDVAFTAVVGKALPMLNVVGRGRFWGGCYGLRRHFAWCKIN